MNRSVNMNIEIEESKIKSIYRVMWCAAMLGKDFSTKIYFQQTTPKDVTETRKK